MGIIIIPSNAQSKMASGLNKNRAHSARRSPVLPPPLSLTFQAAELEEVLYDSVSFCSPTYHPASSSFYSMSLTATMSITEFTLYFFCFPFV